MATWPFFADRLTFGTSEITTYGIGTMSYGVIFGGAVGDQGSGVQSSILFPGLHSECICTTKASASSGVIQYLEPNWQLLENKPF